MGRVFGGCSGKPRPARSRGNGCLCEWFQVRLGQKRFDLCSMLDKVVTPQRWTSLHSVRPASESSRICIMPSDRQRLPTPFDKPCATCRLSLLIFSARFVSLSNLTLSACCFPLPSHSLSCSSVDTQRRSEISSARSRCLEALVALFTTHATCNSS